jgi:hypothetical protein
LLGKIKEKISSQWQCTKHLTCRYIYVTHESLLTSNGSSTYHQNEDNVPKEQRRRKKASIIERRQRS